MSYTQILFETGGRVATITFNRPERLNAFTYTLAGEMVDALKKVDANDDLRVTVVTGAGRGFCAGMDLAAGGTTFNPGAQQKSGRERMDLSVSDLLPSLLNLKKPIIVAVNGPAVGVGLTMILPMDIRIAAESARFGMVFVRRGVVPELASPWFLPRIIGVSKAAELMYTGRIIGAKEALECGLVSKVVPDAELMNAAQSMANEIAANTAPVSVALTRHMLWKFLAESDLNRVEEINHAYFAWTGAQPDCQEGIMSFLEKRPPDWKMKVSKDMPEFFPLS
ncbi:MAG: enoyl-CoA hydratase [Candidatus Abyssobacteria bacterium SURF_5]|uniref:Enoyl-CoA hydratase n=1 Tax=Abyssobacteria bacterium (strain SURF_5) TaxID=2093360 RepID=A0A3A4NSY9_ABYX5|nr:MAG: enoyl-CoA hydratase [Candidatus Abyssubacteria bacterium SURF_5]